MLGKNHSYYKSVSPLQFFIHAFPFLVLSSQYNNKYSATERLINRQVCVGVGEAVKFLQPSMAQVHLFICALLLLHLCLIYDTGKLNYLFAFDNNIKCLLNEKRQHLT